jgi:hypothetical protein
MPSSWVAEPPVRIAILIGCSDSPPITPIEFTTHSPPIASRVSQPFFIHTVSPSAAAAETPHCCESERSPMSERANSTCSASRTSSYSASSSTRSWSTAVVWVFPHCSVSFGFVFASP